MMDISCQVIRDLLPLYHDGVCSDESRRLVERHLRDCPECRAELSAYGAETIKENNMNEAKLIQDTANKWKKNKAAAFFKGALIAALLCCAACIAAFNIIGSYVAADGTLVEPFGFIPLVWLFALMALIFGVGLIIARRIKKKD